MSSPAAKKEFCDITGASDSKAEQFLKYANWDLQLAVARFFEDSSDPSGGQRGIGGGSGMGGGMSSGWGSGGWPGRSGGGIGGGIGATGPWTDATGGMSHLGLSRQELMQLQMMGAFESQGPPKPAAPKPSGYNKLSVLVVEHVFEDGTKLQVRHGDMTEEDVGAIVNAANKHLDHGWFSGFHSGEMVQIESDIHISENGPLKEGEAVALGGHELKCTYVIHAVGPMWNGGVHGEQETLDRCVENCLNLANNLSLKSISLPAISTGIFKFPKPICATIMFGVVINWLNNNPKTAGRKIEEVRFTNFDDETVYLMKKEFHKRFGGGDDEPKKVPPQQPEPAPAALVAVEQKVLREPEMVIQKEPEEVEREWEQDADVELVDLDQEDTD